MKTSAIRARVASDIPDTSFRDILPQSHRWPHTFTKKILKSDVGRRARYGVVNIWIGNPNPCIVVTCQDYLISAPTRLLPSWSFHEWGRSEPRPKRWASRSRVFEIV